MVNPNIPSAGPGGAIGPNLPPAFPIVPPAPPPGSPNDGISPVIIPPQGPGPVGPGPVGPNPPPGPPIVPPPPGSTPDMASGSGLSRNTIIMIAVLCALLLMILGTLAAYLYMKKRDEEKRESDESLLYSAPHFSGKAQDVESGRTIISDLPPLDTALAVGRGSALAAGALYGAASPSLSTESSLPDIIHSPDFDSPDDMYNRAAEHQGLYPPAAPITNIAASLTAIDDPFYEASSLNENLLVTDDQLYVLPPMSRTVFDQNGATHTDPVSPHELTKMRHSVLYGNGESNDDTSGAALATGAAALGTAAFASALSKEQDGPEDDVTVTTKTTTKTVTRIVSDGDLPPIPEEETEFTRTETTTIEPVVGSPEYESAIMVTETTTVIHHSEDLSAPNFETEAEDADIDFDAWAPAAPTSHVVIRTYIPSRRDELKLSIGDLIGIEREFDDGWARVQNITVNRKRGMIPIAVLTPIKSGPTQTVAKGSSGSRNSWRTSYAQEQRQDDLGSARSSITNRESSLKYGNGSLKSKFSTDISSEDDDARRSRSRERESVEVDTVTESKSRSTSRRRVVFSEQDIIINKDEL